MADTLSESDLIGRGEFASIFAFGSNRVVKLYRAEGDAAWQQRLPDYHGEELRAYTLSGEDPMLSAHVPRCYGAFPVRSVVDANGQDASAKYLLNLSVELERLRGSDTKIFAGPMQQYPHMKELLDRFAECGIHALDASVFQPGDAENCKFIDLTTHRGNKILCELIANGPHASASELADFLGLSPATE